MSPHVFVNFLAAPLATSLILGQYWVIYQLHPHPHVDQLFAAY
jgi:hypothetical protein